MVHVRPLVNRLKREGWNGNIQTDIMEVLTDKNVRVLPYFAKQTLRIWAEASRKHAVVGWLEQAVDDVDVFEWVETDPESEPEPEPQSEPEPEEEAEAEEEEEAEAEPEPEAISQTAGSAPSTLDVFHDLETGIASISDTRAREQLLTNLRSLKANLYTSDLAKREEMDRRIDQHDQIIKMLQAQMSGTQKTAAGAVVKSAVGESVAEKVVIVIDSDGEAREERQRKKKKKNKKKKKDSGDIKRESEREKEGDKERKKRKRKPRVAKEEESDDEVEDSEEERRAKREAKKSKK
jgi:hypothetical protein